MTAAPDAGAAPGWYSTAPTRNPGHDVAHFDANTAIVTGQLGSDGYLSSCFASIGRRNYTFTAWESVEAARAALHSGLYDRTTAPDHRRSPTPAPERRHGSSDGVSSAQMAAR